MTTSYLLFRSTSRRCSIAVVILCERLRAATSILRHFQFEPATTLRLALFATLSGDQLDAIV